MAKILIAEDERDIRDLVAFTLRFAGFEVIVATNGEEAVEMAGREVPDLILLDLILPRKDGFEVLAAIKEDKSTHEIPVIVLTNLEGTNDVERAISLGATTYLVKANYELEELVKKIKETLN